MIYYYIALFIFMLPWLSSILPLLDTVTQECWLSKNKSNIHDCFSRRYLLSIWKRNSLVSVRNRRNDYNVIKYSPRPKTFLSKICFEEFPDRRHTLPPVVCYPFCRLHPSHWRVLAVADNTRLSRTRYENPPILLAPIMYTSLVRNKHLSFS